MWNDLAAWVVDPSGLTPHGFCLLWEPGLIWSYAISDTGIGLAYFTIPLALAIFANQRRDLVFRPVFWLFATFILLCGATHWLDVLTLWVPAYGLAAVVKAATALVSVGTAIVLWFLLPHALALPSPGQLQEMNVALRESEALHRRRFEHSPVPMYTLDGVCDTITGVSDSFLTLLGYERDEVVGRKAYDFWIADGYTDATTESDRLFADDRVHEFERRFRHRDGSVLECQVTARRERQGGASWILSAVIDITARRRAEAALRASEERLHQAQKMEAVGQLTGGIAHDFNNMLQGIAGGLDMMERRVTQGRTDEIGRYVVSARQAVDRAARLTARMLAFARRQALQPAIVDPDRLVQGMEELIRRTVEPAIEVELAMHDGVWQALCDPSQLENVILNLAINARDAMQDGGRLTIATADRSYSAADLADQNGVAVGDYVEIAVTDTGTGMPPDVLARAFEPFFTTKPVGQGTGLGLSQMYGFVQQSGGFVRLQSEWGRGTTVRMFLPRYIRGGDQASGEMGGVDAISSASAGPACGTVLVVEDEAGIRELIIDALRDLGCQVLTAPDGPAGLRIVQSHQRFDLLLTDVGLPGLNGRQLAEAARQKQPDLPVLLITGYAGKALDDDALPVGMEVIRKPFAFEALAERVRVLLQAATERRRRDETVSG